MKKHNVITHIILVMIVCSMIFSFNTIIEGNNYYDNLYKTSVEQLNKDIEKAKHEAHLRWKESQKDYEWECFIKALTWVESRHNDNAVNSQSKATGQFQIMPVYVAEANRLQSKVKYTLSDRTNYKKSREMFDIIQANKNPKKNKRLACRLHYGKDCPHYYGKVMRKFNEYYIIK